MPVLRKYALLSLLLGVLLACNSSKFEDQMETEKFDWQGHRGARGLLPENTIPAFLEALKYPVTTLELDVVISKDSQVVISHEPWLSPAICAQPSGEAIPEVDPPAYPILEMGYAALSRFNCGLPAPGFPEQQARDVAKPLLADMLTRVETYCRETGRDLPRYNIEIKSRPEWDNELTPEPARFAALLLQVVQEAGTADRTCIQSFDVRSLEAVHEQTPEMTTAYLIENQDSLAENLNRLSFRPSIYSPYYQLLDKAAVAALHERGISVIPWTVNEPALMQELIEMGVDGIITDYPNRIPGVK